jgi:hypothetical protein
VATDWGPVVQTGIGAAAAVAGGLLTAWYQSRVHERAERHQRKESAAEVVTAALQLHFDSDPEALADMDDQAALKRIDELSARSDVVRTQLLILATSYPSRKVRDQARQVPNLLTEHLRCSMACLAARVREDAAAQEEAEKAEAAAGKKALDALADLATAIDVAG